MSLFIEKSEAFLVDPGKLKKDPNLDLMRKTVRYLLDNARGFKNRKPTQEIIEYLRRIGYPDLKREHWQTFVMDRLREHGIFIGSKIGGGGGIFIIEIREDAVYCQESYKQRIKSEQDHLALLEEQMHEAKWI